MPLFQTAVYLINKVILTWQLLCTSVQFEIIWGSGAAKSQAIINLLWVAEAESS